MLTRCGIATVVAWAIVLAPVWVDAACTATSEAGAVRKSIRQANRCDYRSAARRARSFCAVTPPPACAGTLVTDANNLAFGSTALAEVDRRVLRDQFSCQKRIGKAVSHYVGTKLRFLIKRQDAGRGRGQGDQAARQAGRRSAPSPSPRIPARGSCCRPSARSARPRSACRPRRSTPPRCATACASSARCGSTAGGPNPQPLRPNIIFILTDDQRWDTTDDDALARRRDSTIMPGLRSELGGSGVEFANAFMTTPLCCPSRSSILRGQYAHSTGVYTNGGNNGGADDFDDSSRRPSAPAPGAGYRTGFIGKYLNGYTAAVDERPSRPTCRPAGRLARLPATSRFFDYDHDRERRRGVLRHRRGRLLDRRAAREGEAVHHRLGGARRAVLPLSLVQGAARPVRSRRRATTACSPASPPWRPPSYNEPDVSDKPTWVQNTPQLTPTRAAPISTTSASSSSRCCRRSTRRSAAARPTASPASCSTCATSASPTTPSSSTSPTTAGTGASTASGPRTSPTRSRSARRCSSATRSSRRCRASETQFALNIDFCPTFAELALRADAIRADRSRSTAPAWCACSTAPRRPGAPTSCTEGWPASHVWATVREAQWKYTELPVHAGRPDDRPSSSSSTTW